MKKIRSKLILIILVLVLLPLSEACFNPTDSFASEVVLNKPGIQYNLGSFLKGRNFLYEKNRYIFQSEYDNKIACILSEITSPVCETNCLSVRLQIPIESEYAKFPYFSIISTIIGKINLSDEKNYKGWIILPGIKSVEFKKEQINIFVSSIGLKHDIIIEINEDLENCDKCDGKCIYPSYREACIPRHMKQDIEDILKFSGLIDNFNDLFINSRSVGGERSLSDLKPTINKEIDWGEAMRQELVWLKKSNVIRIENKDIELIARMSEKGKAGYNYRMVYSEEGWKYYYDTENAVLSREINCEEFSSKKISKYPLDFKKKIIPIYYLVPLLTALFLALLLFVLFLLGRAITKRKTKKNIKKANIDK